MAQLGCSKSESSIAVCRVEVGAPAHSCMVAHFKICLLSLQSCLFSQSDLVVQTLYKDFGHKQAGILCLLW